MGVMGGHNLESPRVIRARFVLIWRSCVLAGGVVRAWESAWERWAGERVDRWLVRRWVEGDYRPARTRPRMLAMIYLVCLLRSAVLLSASCSKGVLGTGS